MNESADYRQVSDALAVACAEVGAAECHGMFCGALCAGGQTGAEAVAAQVLGGLDREHAKARESVRCISQLLSATMAQLSSEDLQLQLRLLLPEDEVLLAERSSALGYWCQGFMMGLSAGGLTGATRLEKDTRDFLLDLTNISRQLQPADGAAPERSEEEETAFFEVEEYVRVGVMLMYEGLREQRPGTTVH